ncbi:glycosyltransferase family 2 protein [Maribacter ulvicola]|uniref:Glycosyltransferase involved in cell wall bisynthesis n=1 Tax=Maribacter ulvicola TaxID=228959 RepID=A0A1N6SDH2_9FLAO|nr:glycosyltransferase family 2 protein [Maribacter ulvicola]SIQ39195.1 Glycosyltransferase involved in cell wall bisynthesis [Maribacter ulvicola]
MLQDKKISALIITYNEIDNIARCINGVSFADEIIVVDSFSTDGTYEYLKNHPKITVKQHPFKDYTSQKSYTLKQANNDWVLFIDADEVVTENLKNEILQTIKTTKHSSFWFYRTFIFKDEKINFCGCQTDKNQRLFRKSKVEFAKDKIVHEKLIVDGKIGALESKLIHYSYKNYKDFKNKIDSYGSMKAIQDFRKNKKFSYFKLILKPFWKFFYSYFIRLGFLDGLNGATLCYIYALGEIKRFRTLKEIEQEESTKIPTLQTALKST